MHRHPRLGYPGSPRPAAPRPLRGVRRDTMRILVVDRDEDRRDLTCVSVSVLGHRVEEAWDTRGALIALATEAFDVIIVDDQIPGFDIVEVTEFLVAASGRARRRPAVIVVSADLDISRRVALFRAGVVEVVNRPLSLAPLYGVLTRIDRTLPA